MTALRITAVSALLLLAFMTCASQASAQFINDSQQSFWMPANTVFGMVYYDHSVAHTLLQDGHKIKAFNLTADVSLLRIGGFKEVLNKNLEFNFAVPMGKVTLDGAAVNGIQSSSRGVGDPVINIAVQPWRRRAPGKHLDFWLDFSTFVTHWSIRRQSRTQSRRQCLEVSATDTSGQCREQALHY